MDGAFQPLALLRSNLTLLWADPNHARASIGVGVVVAIFMTLFGVSRVPDSLLTT